MRDYFIRRFLLIFPTLIGATMVVFFITRVTPGGPLEAALRQAAAQQGEGGMKDAGASLSEEQKKDRERILNQKIGAAGTEVESVANRFNEQVRVFREKNKKQ